MNTTAREIMVITDKESVYDSIKKANGFVGETIYGIKDAQEALLFLKNSTPDFLLLDTRFLTPEEIVLIAEITALGMSGRSKYGELYDILESAKIRRTEIMNYSIYKGILVSDSGVVLDILEDEVLIRARKNQAFAVKQKGEIYLSSPIFKSFVKGSVTHVDMESYTIHAKNLTYVGESPSERKIPRVEFDKNVSVVLKIEASSCEARLIDLSISSVGILTSDISSLQEGAEIKATLYLKCETGIDDVELTALVTKIFEPNNGVYKIVLMIEKEEMSEMLLESHIKLREAEIIQELSSM